MLTPALIWPDFEIEKVASKTMRKRLMRAERRDIPARDSLALATTALGIAAPPAGALARIAEGLEGEGCSWFCAEPVTLIPDGHRLIMLPLDDAPLTEEEAKDLADAARAHFGSDLCLELGSSGRWYAALPAIDDAMAGSPREMARRPLDAAGILRGSDAPRLHAFFNELQMLWHTHPVNLARREAGQPEASALWLWGGGRLSAKPDLSDPETIHGGEPELVGLARWLGVAHKVLAAPETGRREADALVVIGAEADPLGEAWLKAFAATKAAWRLYAANAEWRIPARRGLFRRRGW
jgi:hypothetical protein